MATCRICNSNNLLDAQRCASCGAWLDVANEARGDSQAGQPDPDGQWPQGPGWTRGQGRGRVHSRSDYTHLRREQPPEPARATHLAIIGQNAQAHRGQPGRAARC